MRHSLSTAFASHRRAITMLQPRFRIHAPFARANDGGARIKQNTDGDDGEGKKTRARPRRNRSARRELQGNPTEVRTRARSVLRDDPGQRAERIGPALVLALRRNRPKPASPLSPKDIGRNRKRISPGIGNEFCNGGNEADAPTFLFKCSNLARGESTKDPVYIFGCRRGFRFTERTACDRMRTRAMRSGGSDHRITQELTRPLWRLPTGKGASCPYGWKF